MAGQAGWYRAPGEDGMLRYWNGTKWTDHRQPAPVADPAPAPLIAENSDPDPMAEYERQFAASPSPFDRPSLDLDQRSFDAVAQSIVASAPAPALAPAPQPQYRPQAALAPAPTPVITPQFAGSPAVAPRSIVPQPIAPLAPGSAAIALPAAMPAPRASSAPVSEFEQVLRESEAIAVAPKTAVNRETLAIEAPAVGIAPNRKAVLGAAVAMGVAILVIVLGFGAMTFFNVLSQAGAGEAKTTGIVMSLGAVSGDDCTPVARFAVNGRSFTASSNAAITPCPVGLGQDVDVIYSAANPAAAARIQLGTALVQYLWLIPLAGILFFLGSLTAFVVRAGSIAAGVALLRDGRKKSKKLIARD